MKNRIKTAAELLKKRRYNEFFFELCKVIPFNLIVYSNFYFVKCDTLADKIKIKPLDKKYKIFIEDFNYDLLERIKKELPHNLETVYYRLEKKEDKTKIIIIEHNDRIVAIMFFLYDSSVPSPSGYFLGFNKEKVLTCYDVYIDHKYRFKGLHLHLFSSAFEISKAFGNPGLYGEIHFLNKNSILSHHRLGFYVYKNIHYIQILGKKYFFEGSKKFWCVKYQNNTSS